VVGCLGDGINDAPALRSADVGISVQNAVDVAKDAADIILLEKRLTVLHDGVIEGRRSFGNIMKYVLMGTSSNFGNMLSMATASLFLPFLPMLPLQILLNNFLYDLSQAPIPTDRVDASYMLKPRRWNIEFIRRYMLVIRTADRPWRSRPSRALGWGVGACVSVGATLPFTPVAPWLGLVPLPPLFFAFLAAMVLGYLAMVEAVKRVFYRRYAL
jgi:Mg2+-importing ATPase